MQLSPARMKLCSRQNAQRVADRLFDEAGENIAVVRTSSVVQPYQAIPVSRLEPTTGTVLLEVTA